MAYGVVLRPDADVSRSLVELSHAIGDGHEPLMLLGEKAPPHVSVVHFDCADDATAGIAAATVPHRGRSFAPKIIGLLYTVVPAGDYYVPAGGYYFGLEMIRTPELDELHQEFLQLGHPPLGLVGEDYRPHITLGVTAEPPGQPPFAMVPTGIVRVTMASGPVGPVGTFPELAS
ncbi:2'-5' RNA ligase family protein [Actinoplanes bogorensis]|uniref:2'-5' RNA ligase family protein n=1 Tax=Paractinoplanes bogorensis TaxID=1610840 RepID=A0ABS5YU16_9ACTN|nr:2'-5' RNA ligase family protein [Actinoplanes bogorensis]MBU2665565.1 2'-5' RNA ligase family protein [Actinoplanes bogorensis]